MTAVRESGIAQRYADDRAVLVLRRLVLLSHAQADNPEEQLVIEGTCVPNHCDHAPLHIRSRHPGGGLWVMGARAVDVWKFDVLGLIQDLEIVMCRCAIE